MIKPRTFEHNNLLIGIKWTYIFFNGNKDIRLRSLSSRGKCCSIDTQQINRQQDELTAYCKNFNLELLQHSNEQSYQSSLLTRLYLHGQASSELCPLLKSAKIKRKKRKKWGKKNIWAPFAQPFFQKYIYIYELGPTFTNFKSNFKCFNWNFLIFNYRNFQI